jgi:immune inhibitor A
VTQTTGESRETTQLARPDRCSGNRTRRLDSANVPADRDPAAAQARKQDDLRSPLGEKQRDLREKATQQLIKGTAKIETRGGQRVINVGKDGRSGKVKYVQYAVEREESILTILSDFGNVAKSDSAGERPAR